MLVYFLIITVISIVVSMLLVAIYVVFYKRHINKRILGTSKVKHFIAPIYLFLIFLCPTFLATSTIGNVFFKDSDYDAMTGGNQQREVILNIENEFSAAKRLHFLRYSFSYVSNLGDRTVFSVKNENDFESYMKSLTYYISYQENAGNQYYLFYLQKTYLTVTKEKNSDKYLATEASIKFVNNGDSIPIVPSNILLLSNSNFIMDDYAIIDVSYSFERIKEFYQHLGTTKIDFNDENQTILVKCLSGNTYTLLYKDFKLKVSLD